MRVPRKPPDWIEIISRKGPTIAEHSRTESMRDFLRLAESRHWHWAKLEPAARQAGVDPESAWVILKAGRDRRSRAAPLLRSKEGRPISFALPDQAWRELMMVDRELAGHIAFADEAPLTKEVRDRFIIGSLMEEAIASSQLEGADTARRLAKDMLRSGRTPRTRGEQMIVNNYRAIQFLRDRRESKLTPDVILELQEIVVRNTLDDEGHAGRLRVDEDDVVVENRSDGSVLHEPPAATELPERLRRLCDFANVEGQESEEFVHPVVRAILIHYQLAYDHPFCDGNGRTARALFYWSVLNAGYWLFEFLPISRLILNSPGRYGRAFLYTETDDDDVTYFINYNLDIISKARAELRSYLAKKQREIADARVVFEADDNLNHRQRALLLHAMRHPDGTYTIEGHRASHGIVYQTARADLLALADLGFLRRHTGGRAYVFTAGPRLRTIAIK